MKNICNYRSVKLGVTLKLILTLIIVNLVICNLDSDLKSLVFSLEQQHLLKP